MTPRDPDTVPAARLVGLLSALAVDAIEAEEPWRLRRAIEGIRAELRPALASAVNALLLHVAPDVAIAAAHVLTPIAVGPLAPERPWCALPASAETPARLRWLLGAVAPYARDLAALALYAHLPAAQAEAEVREACIGTARHEGWPEALGADAAPIAWADAYRRAGDLAERLRRRLWPLGRAAEPGGVILAAAEAVTAEAGMWLPDDVLTDAARRIAHAAARGGRRVGAR